MKRIAAALVTAVLTLTVLGTTSSGATAVAPTREQVTIPDPADATGAGVDIREVSLDRSAGRGLVAEIRVTDLRRDASAGMAFYVDLDRDRSGPELVLNAGLFSGTDYVLVGAKGWNDVKGEPLSCTHIMRLKYRQDLVKVRIGPDCLGEAERLRVALTTGDDTDPSHPITDWLGKRRSWSGWLTTA